MDRLLLSIIAASGLWVLHTQAERQYHFVYEEKNMTEALSYCRDKHTDLASIHNIYDVELLNNQVDLNRMVNSYEAWIGLYNDVASWRWSLSDRSFYKHGESTFRHWSHGEPNNKYGTEECAQMYDNGKWNDVPCERSYMPVCSDVTGLNVTFVLVNTIMSWSEAQSYCREHHTHLASVRDMDQNKEVKQLIPAGVNVWIGLHRESWKWTDGSNSSFRHWRESQPDNYLKNETCAAARLNDSGSWEDSSCHHKRAFICFRDVSRSHRVVKVRLVKSSSSLDLNDPAVMDAMLKQLKQKLKDQRMKGDVRLSWRKQADGNVFHKEKKITKAKDEL